MAVVNGVLLAQYVVRGLHSTTVDCAPKFSCFDFDDTFNYCIIVLR
jgi:hypothetical protein